MISFSNIIRMFSKDMVLFFFTRGRKIKILNKYAVLFQKRVLKNSRIIGYPYEILIDPTNLCGLSCKLCPTGQKNPVRPKTVMKFEEYKKIIDEIGPYVSNLFLTNWGEPLLNKDIFKMIDYAHEKKIYTYLSTTLSKIDDKIVENIAESKLDNLTVSLDGASQETAEEYQIGIEFNKVIDRVGRIAKRKRELGKKSPQIQWRFIIMGHNEHEIPIAKKKYKQYGFDILELAKVRCDMGKEVFLTLKQQFENVKPFLPKDEKHSLYNYKEKRKKHVLKNTCSYLWTQAVINSDGSLSPCCAVYDKKHDFGNVLESGFKNVWNNEKYQNSRRLIGKGKNGDTPPICKVCYSNQAML